MLVVVFGNDVAAGPPTTTAPAGWTQITTGAAATDIRVQAFWALGSVASVTFTNSAGTLDQGWVCLGFTGVDNVTPVDATGTANTGAGAASLTTNAVTVATDQAWHLIAFASWNSGTDSATSFTAVHCTATPPAANADAALLYNTTPKATGSTGTVSVSSSASATGQELAAIPFALRPAAVAGQVPWDVPHSPSHQTMVAM